MIVPLITRTYPTPEPRPLKLFPSGDKFATKLRKHMLSPAEPWARLLTRGFIMDVGRRLGANDPNVLADAYPPVAEVLDAAIRFAVDRPVFMRADHPDHGADTCYFVAESGFMLVAFNGAVRTAYFVCHHPEESAHTMFHNAWRKIRSRALKPRLRSVNGVRTMSFPRDVTDQPDAPKSPKTFRVRWFDRVNWTTCPNPHSTPHPSRTVPPRFADWLDDIDPDRRASRS